MYKAWDHHHKIFVLILSDKAKKSLTIRQLLSIKKNEGKPPGIGCEVSGGHKDKTQWLLIEACLFICILHEQVWLGCIL